MKNSDFQMRKVAAALYGIPGCDATPEQIANAKKAYEWYVKGQSMSLIMLKLRIKRQPPASLPVDDARIVLG